MNKLQKIQMASLKRGVIVLVRLPDVPACADALRLRDELQECVTRLDDIHVEQNWARRGRGSASGSIDDAIRTLRRRHLIRVARRARRLFKHDVDVLNAVRVPPGRASAQEHAKAAARMAKALRPHLAFCHAEGFRRGFLTELQEAGKQLGKMAKLTDTARTEYSRATSRLGQDVLDGRELASLIDAELRALVLPGSGLTKDQRSDLETTLYIWAREIKLRHKVGRPPKPRVRPPKRPPSSGAV